MPVDAVLALDAELALCGVQATVRPNLGACVAFALTATAVWVAVTVFRLAAEFQVLPIGASCVALLELVVLATLLARRAGAGFTGAVDTTLGCLAAAILRAGVAVFALFGVAGAVTTGRLAGVVLAGLAEGTTAILRAGRAVFRGLANLIAACDAGFAGSSLAGLALGTAAILRTSRTILSQIALACAVGAILGWVVVLGALVLLAGKARSTRAIRRTRPTIFTLAARPVGTASVVVVVVVACVAALVGAAGGAAILRLFLLVIAAIEPEEVSALAGLFVARCAGGFVLTSAPIAVAKLLSWAVEVVHACLDALLGKFATVEAVGTIEVELARDLGATSV